MRRILAASLLLSLTAPAAAQDRTVIVEPVTTAPSAVINAPIEYDENGVVKAQYFKADDLTPAQLDALLAEADRVRGYQQANGVYVRPETAAPASTYSAAPSTSFANGGYEIELYEAPASVAAPVAQTRMHTVAKGDTLYNIAKRYDVSVTALQQANGISGSSIGLGQSLAIPGAAPQSLSLNTTAPLVTFASAPVSEGVVTRRIVEPVPSARPVQSVTSAQDTIYAVLPKDTLYAISRRTCVKVPALIAANGIANANALTPGQKLTIPAGHCLTN